MDIENKYKFRFNPKSNRLENFDYSSAGAYFITICTKNKEDFFGEIINGEMFLNDYGKIIQQDIINLEKYYQNVLMDYFVVMPNHIHFVIFLEENKYILEKKCIERKCRDLYLKGLNIKDVSEKHLYEGEYDFNKNYFSNISPKRGNIGSIIKSFKGYATKKLQKLDKNVFFAWQSNYYDRIIRDEDELQRIRKYILENPLKREFSKNNKEGILM